MSGAEYKIALTYLIAYRKYNIEYDLRHHNINQVLYMPS